MIFNLQEIKITELTNVLQDEKIITSFQNFYHKHIDAKLIYIENKALYISVINKNNITQIYIFFFSTENINILLKEIKKKQKYLECTLYVRNKNKNEIFSKIDSRLILKKIINLSFNKNKQIHTNSVKKNNYTLVHLSKDETLTSFFIECFKNEWDENVLKWMKDFEEPNIKKQIIGFKDEDKIISSIMYWVFEKNIYVFLVGTLPKYRKQKLAKLLLKEIHQNHKECTIDLSVVSDTVAHKMYIKLGFQNSSISNVCI